MPCDSCMKNWRSCSCICNDCDGDYSYCKGDKIKCNKQKDEILKIIKNNCDCCGLKWRSCNCCCSNCYDLYKNCKHECYDKKNS